MKKLPKRSILYAGIGKHIGGRIYVHKQYENAIVPLLFLNYAHAIAKENNFDYDVISYKNKDSSVTLTKCLNFDREHEPTILSQITINGNGRRITKRHYKKDFYIYHHKWLMVHDSYKGFDVSKSKERSKRWMALDNVDYSRIGKKSYWDKHVVPRI